MNSNEQATLSPDAVGVVVIGRNEGERLKRCIESLLTQGAGPLVYVDSGSTDGSVEYARSRDVTVESLDMTLPFTMARGRNAGFEKLMKLYPGLNWVQFVDGDCEVEAGWIESGLEFLKKHDDVVTVCGFRRERFPLSTPWNRLIDMEWQGPVGDIAECGGDAMYRTGAFTLSGGFDAGMIAGEEPELCVRLRKQGGRIWRINEPMTLHDAAMTRFSQWWKRNVRSGHAWAEGFDKQGAAPYHHNRRSLLSALVLGAVLPMFCLVSLFLVGTWPWLAVFASLLLVLAWGKAGYGAYRHRINAGNSASDARFYACLCIPGKVPEALGAIKYGINKLLGRRSGLIEYKHSA